VTSAIKVAFVTIGATADFPELVQGALAPKTLQSFKDSGYTTITLQVGKQLKYFNTIKSDIKDTLGLNISAFEFNSSGLGKEMLAAKEKEDKSSEGVVISHAGAGTVLDALRLGLPLIVVPNRSLLDNHQQELAEELERQGYVVRADVDDLADAVREVERTRKARKVWEGTRNPSVKEVVDETVGYEEEVRSSLD